MSVFRIIRLIAPLPLLPLTAVIFLICFDNLLDERMTDDIPGGKSDKTDAVDILQDPLRNL